MSFLNIESQDSNGLYVVDYHDDQTLQLDWAVDWDTLCELKRMADVIADMTKE